MTPGMPTAWTVPPGRGDAQRLGDATRRSRRSRRRLRRRRRAGRCRAHRAGAGPHRSVQLARRDDAASAPSSAASSRWWGCLAVAMISAPGRARRSAAIVSRPRVPLPITATSSASTSEAACTAQAVGSTSTAASSDRSSGTRDELALVGHHQRGPPAAGALAEAALQPGLQVAEADALAVVDAALGARPGTRGDAAGHAAEHRDDGDAGAVVEVADHLVAGRERERHDRLEPARRRAVDRRQVRAADAGEPGPHPHPARTGQRRAGRRRAAPAARPWRRRRARAGRPRSRPRTWPASARTPAPSSASDLVVDLADAAAAGTAPRGADREERGRDAGRLVEVLDEPAALAGEGGEAGLGVHGDREADGLEHRAGRRWSRRRRRPRRRRSRAASA